MDLLEEFKGSYDHESLQNELGEIMKIYQTAPPQEIIDESVLSAILKKISAIRDSVVRV